VYIFIRTAIKQVIIITEEYHFVNYVQNVIQHSALQVTSVLVIISVDFDARVQILIIYLAFVKYWRKNGNIQ
jgi:hypothetical protein